jgi:arginase family enzyme
VCLFGVRSFEHGEAALLKRLGVKVFYTHEIEARGVARALREAIEVVAAAPAGFGITLDLDAVDPADAPGVGTPAANGIRASDLIAALAEHRTARDLLAIEIVEFNPLRDREAATAGIVSDALDALLGQSVIPVRFATRSKRTVQRAVV